MPEPSAACPTSIEAGVAAHDGHGSLVERVLRAIDDEFGAGAAVAPARLAALDEFHTCGRAATEELLDALALDASARVLDVGCGLGGAARHAVQRTGCHVTGIDLVDEYVDAARALSARCGLADRLEFRQASALSLPFSDARFDAALTQHACMNIPDKAGVYDEVRRVLAPRGLFGIYDILAGPGGEPIFPEPWAADASTSFLAAPEDVRRMLEQAGFEILSWRDRTTEVRRWIEDLAGRAAEGGPPPRLGFHLLLGDTAPTLLANLRRSLAERRIRPFEIVCRAY